MVRSFPVFRAPVVTALALVAPLAIGCSGGTPASASAAAISVESTATECRVSATSAPAGAITFTVKNSGDEETEFYLYSADGTKVIGEVEDIGPGLTRDLTVQAQPGSYLTACKPGMTGDGIRAAFTVTG